MDEAALPPELAEKARFELNETKENKLEGIQALRDRISQSRPDITLPEDHDLQGQDTFLVRFLRARKFDPDKAFELLCQYQEFKVKNKSLFEKATASELHFVLEDGIPCVLPESDSNGCRIVVLFAGSWDTDTYGMEEILKALLISIEHLLESEEVQINGIVLLADFTGWGSTHASLVSVSSLRQAIVMFQVSYWPWSSNGEDFHVQLNANDEEPLFELICIDLVFMCNTMQMSRRTNCLSSFALIL